jgi:hypothetical protein
MRFIDFYFLGRHRLEDIQLLPLGCSLSDAIALYGEPFESQPAEESAEIMVHTFQIGKYHEAVAMVWQDRIRSITYWSEKADPSRDLRCMLERYQDDSRWLVLEEGYWYQREDGKRKLWCSAVPAIGVADVEFLTAKSQLQLATDLKKLVEMEDPTWAPDNAISDLQRRFVTGLDRALLDFARRSNRIVVSADGRDVLIVRDHHAYNVEDGFIELNCPPEPDKGYSTQVINFFTWSDDGSSWGKAALPRDANVESINIHGDTCHLKIRCTTTGRILLLSNSVSAIRSLSVMSFDKPLQDEKMWAALEVAEAEARDPAE